MSNTNFQIRENIAKLIFQKLVAYLHISLFKYFVKLHTNGVCFLRFFKTMRLLVKIAPKCTALGCCFHFLAEAAEVAVSKQRRLKNKIKGICNNFRVNSIVIWSYSMTRKYFATFFIIHFKAFLQMFFGHFN